MADQRDGEILSGSGAEVADTLASMSKPIAILFDFGGTLDHPSHWLDRFLSHYRAAGFEMTREELDPAFDFATKAGYAAGKPIERFALGDLVRFLVGNQFEYLRGEGPERIRQILGAMDSRARFQSVERIRESFLKETTAGLARSREVLSRLKSGYRLGVISNWYGNLETIIAEAGMSRIFDSITDSTRVRAFKPDPAIFRAALKAIGTEANQAAMVGDSMTKDLAPAHLIGMRTVWLRSIRDGDSTAALTAQSSDGIANGFAPDHTIHSLAQMLDLAW
jgi:putative hydrolase of the HAD superfamily